MEIFVSLDLNKAQIQRLREIAGMDQVHVTGLCQDGEPPALEFLRCEIAFGNPPPEWLATAPSLRWVQLESTGFGEYASIDWSAAGNRPIFTNLAGFFAEAVAETCLAGILALYRGLDECVSLKEQKEWKGDALRLRIRTILGAKVVLFGFGSINRRLAELLRPFDCEIAKFDSQWKPKELDIVLANADIVICAAPDTLGTRQAFCAARLARIPRCAVFANFGRGSVVDEAALAQFLAVGKIGGAVIDVTNDEPLPPEHPFWECPNLILTQHSGGGTADELDRKLDLFAANLERFRAGEPLTGIVDFTRGY